MISEIISGIFKPLTNIADKLILDKDKYAELQFKKIELTHDLKSKLLEQTTTPKMDAVVKLLVTFNDVILPLLRPLGSFAMAGFAMYCTVNNIDLGETVETMLFGSPLAWMGSRHINKQTEQKEKTARASLGEWDDD